MAIRDRLRSERVRCRRLRLRPRAGRGARAVVGARCCMQVAPSPPAPATPRNGRFRDRPRRSCTIRRRGVDGAGDVYVLDRGHDQIVEFESDGNEPASQSVHLCSSLSRLPIRPRGHGPRFHRPCPKRESPRRAQ